eukprot:1632-Heterococcus_DN1.PRE.2
MQNRHPQDFKPLHLIQFPVTDTPQDAEASLEASDDLESDVGDIIDKFQATTERSILHQVCHI